MDELSYFLTNLINVMKQTFVYILSKIKCIQKFENLLKVDDTVNNVYHFKQCLSFTPKCTIFLKNT